MHRDVVHLAVCSFNTGFLVTGSEDGHARTAQRWSVGALKGVGGSLWRSTSFVDWSQSLRSSSGRSSTRVSSL